MLNIAEQKSKVCYFLGKMLYVRSQKKVGFGDSQISLGSVATSTWTSGSEILTTFFLVNQSILCKFLETQMVLPDLCLFGHLMHLTS